VIKNYILSAALLIPASGFSQNRQNGFIHLEGLSIKTDALTLLNLAIGESKSYALAGELYFNEAYSLNVDMNLETEEHDDLNRVQKRFTSQLRWYFKQDDCNCSAFFTGIYFSNVHISQSVDHRHSHSHGIDYNRSSFESGICGGYQAIVARHFVIDPGVQAGLEFYHTAQSTEPMSGLSDADNKGLIVRMQLGIGYRF
jgi:hypothetical protein